MISRLNARAFDWLTCVFCFIFSLTSLWMMVTSKWSLRKCHQMFQTWNNSLTCLSDWPIGIASSWLHLLGWPVMSSWLCFLEWPLPSPWFCLIDWPLKSCCTSVSGQQSCDYFMYYHCTRVHLYSICQEHVILWVVLLHKFVRVCCISVFF